MFSRNTVERELDEELLYHLERQVDEELAAGKTPEEARYAALRSIKDIEQRKEECRDMRRLNWSENAVQDLRYALRQLRKSPAFACTTIFVLALGISATVTIFGFVDAALIKPLPYRDQARLVAVLESCAGTTPCPFSYQDFSDWRRLNHVFESIDAYALNGGFTLRTRTGVEQVPGTRVSAEFFQTLGVLPVLGRDFRAGGESSPAPHTVIISYGEWQKRFGGKTDVLGKTVTLNGFPHTVIGVLPRDFQFAPYGGSGFWANLRPADYECERERSCHNLAAVARLEPGVTIAKATADLRVVAHELQMQYPDSNRQFDGADLKVLRDVIIGDVRPILLVLLSGAGLLLLVACLNVTTLLLARCEKRGRETAVRGALGASATRLSRQFAIEGFAVAMLGAALGLAVAGWGMYALKNLIPPEKIDSMPYLQRLGFDASAGLLVCAIWLAAGALFTAVPIAHMFLSKIIEGLKEGARGSSGMTWHRFGSSLVVIEVCIAMVLMIGAGLLGKSLYLLLHVDLGFNADHLATVQTSWDPSASYTTAAQQRGLEQQILKRISRLPGVRSAAISIAPPINSAWPTTSFHVAGRPNRGEQNEVLDRRVSAGYFTTLQARLEHGRFFEGNEDSSKPPVAVINQALVTRYFGGEDPIGQQIYYDWRPKSPIQIIGVVADIKEGPLEGAPMPTLYVPYDQNPVAWPAVLVRTSQTAAALLPEIVKSVRGIDPFISVSGGETMTERIDQSPSAYLHRSSALLVGTFAASALLLSVVGLYGVVAYSVSQRTREIGIRMALGAERISMYRLILTEAGRLILFGILLGLALSLTTATLMRSLLFGVRSWDIPTLSIVAAVFGLSALLASYIPARRAASVNPSEALRSE
jgi:predicted permease